MLFVELKSFRVREVRSERNLLTSSTKPDETESTGENSGNPFLLLIRYLLSKFLMSVENITKRSSLNQIIGIGILRRSTVTNSGLKHEWGLSPLVLIDFPELFSQDQSYQSMLTLKNISKRVEHNGLKIDRPFTAKVFVSVSFGKSLAERSVAWIVRQSNLFTEDIF